MNDRILSTHTRMEVHSCVCVCVLECKATINYISTVKQKRTNTESTFEMEEFLKLISTPSGGKMVAM